MKVEDDGNDEKMVKMMAMLMSAVEEMAKAKAKR